MLETKHRAALGLKKSLDFARQLGIQFPAMIQAPMAGGITTPSLVASVSNAGGLGSFATGYLKADEVPIFPSLWAP